MIRRRFCRTLLALALCGAALSPQAARASDRASADSVVKIICTLPGGGEATATGFVWPGPGQAVTALHAVAGCVDVSIWSEATGYFDHMTQILSVDLESDLALIEMEDGLGLPAVQFAPEPPDTRADHFVWGYPLVAQEMIDLEIKFGGGRKAGVTTLGAAFKSSELDDLFRGQDYPARETSILRVNTTIQPGQSGAPIFDADGRVVAIVDGGLLGGFRGINWSIPAYAYLPDLPSSADPVPDAPSNQAILHSNATPVEPSPKSTSMVDGSTGVALLCRIAWFDGASGTGSAENGRSGR
jgi:S1-C subfamily serine protease